MPPDTPRQYHRLTAESFEALEKQCPKPFVQGTTTELQAGFMLGVTHVLNLVRQGYVIGA